MSVKRVRPGWVAARGRASYQMTGTRRFVIWTQSKLWRPIYLPERTGAGVRLSEIDYATPEAAMIVAEARPGGRARLFGNRGGPDGDLHGFLPWNQPGGRLRTQGRLRSYAYEDDDDYLRKCEGCGVKSLDVTLANDEYRALCPDCRAAQGHAHPFHLPDHGFASTAALRLHLGNVHGVPESRPLRRRDAPQGGAPQHGWPFAPPPAGHTRDPCGGVAPRPEDSLMLTWTRPRIGAAVLEAQTFNHDFSILELSHPRRYLLVVQWEYPRAGSGEDRVEVPTITAAKSAAEGFAMNGWFRVAQARRPGDPTTRRIPR